MNEYKNIEGIMAKAVKLADIAEQVGVSTVTVSKALSGQKGVSEEMREKIKNLAEELDTAVLQRRNGSLRKNNIISES